MATKGHGGYELTDVKSLESCCVPLNIPTTLSGFTNDEACDHADTVVYADDAMLPTVHSNSSPTVRGPNGTV